MKNSRLGWYCRLDVNPISRIPRDRKPIIVESELYKLERKGIDKRVTHSNRATPIVIPHDERRYSVRICGEFKR